MNRDRSGLGLFFDGFVPVPQRKPRMLREIGENKLTLRFKTACYEEFPIDHRPDLRL